MNKFERLKRDMETAGTGSMKAFGSSMLPVLKSGSLLTFIAAADYEINDIVFCKVKGHYIDAHKIVKKDAAKGFLIANNHGFENGWTKTVYGKVVQASYQGKLIYTARIKQQESETCVRDGSGKPAAATGEDLQRTARPALAGHAQTKKTKKNETCHKR